MQHLLDCKRGGWIVKRHNAMRDCWGQLIAQATGLEPLAEQLLPTPVAPTANTTHLETRRADLVLAGTTQPTYIDVVVPSPVTQGHITNHNTHLTAGAAAAAAEARKHQLYKPHDVTALATEVFGRHGQEALSFLQTLRRTAHEHHTDFDTAQAYRSLSLTLQRSNASNILHYLTRPAADSAMPQAAADPQAIPVPTTPRMDPQPQAADLIPPKPHSSNAQSGNNADMQT